MEISKAKCSFCGKEIECPENMKKAKKHCCADCFLKIMANPPKKGLKGLHADIPTERAAEIMQAMRKKEDESQNISG